jgi:hypothetical protein
VCVFSVVLFCSVFVLVVEGEGEWGWRGVCVCDASRDALIAGRYTQKKRVAHKTGVPARRLRVGADLPKDVLDRARDDAAQRALQFALHGVGLAGAGLAVGDDRRVVALFVDSCCVVSVCKHEQTSLQHKPAMQSRHKRMQNAHAHACMQSGTAPAASSARARAPSRRRPPPASRPGRTRGQT